MEKEYISISKSLVAVITKGFSVIYAASLGNIVQIIISPVKSHQNQLIIVFNGWASTFAWSLFRYFIFDFFLVGRIEASDDVDYHTNSKICYGKMAKRKRTRVTSKFHLSDSPAKTPDTIRFVSFYKIFVFMIVSFGILTSSIT